jgi:hypothetical protein
VRKGHYSGDENEKTEAQPNENKNKNETGCRLLQRNALCVVSLRERVRTGWLVNFHVQVLRGEDRFNASIRMEVERRNKHVALATGTGVVALGMIQVMVDVVPMLVV